MTPLLLVAGGGLAREVIAAVQADNKYEIVGIVDDDTSMHGVVIDGVKILGAPDLVADHPDTDVVLCAGGGSTRAALATRLALDPRRYATVVHPAVRIPDSCEIGAGSVLLAGTVLTAAVVIGRHAVVMPNSVLTHDDVVDDFATLCAGVVLGGSVHIGEAAYVGMAAAIRERCTVGAGAVVGMGALVLHDVPAHQTWLGVPAKQRAATEYERPAVDS